MRSESENPSPLVCCGGGGKWVAPLITCVIRNVTASFQPNSMNHMMKADKTDTQADAYAAIAGM